MTAVANPTYFPPLSTADEDGMLMVGREMSVDRLLQAYHRGIFPWPMVDSGVEVLSWWSPDPRAILELDELYVSRRLNRRIRNGQFEVTVDRDFEGVIAGCSLPRRDEDGTWITQALMNSYVDLHNAGFAHSVEVWHNDGLVGGIYGVSLGGYFSGESMFHQMRDASKVALVYLVDRLRQRRFQLFDIQQWTPHTGRLGATEISRCEFLARLDSAIKLDESFD